MNMNNFVFFLLLISFILLPLLSSSASTLFLVVIVVCLSLPFVCNMNCNLIFFFIFHSTITTQTHHRHKTYAQLFAFTLSQKNTVFNRFVFSLCRTTFSGSLLPKHREKLTKYIFNSNNSHHFLVSWKLSITRRLCVEVAKEFCIVL